MSATDDGGGMGDGDPGPNDGAMPADAVDGRSGLSRRTFLKGATIAGSAAVLDSAFAHAKLLVPTPLQLLTTEPSTLLGELASLIDSGTPSFSLALRRREDLLFLRIDGYNLVAKGPNLVRKKAGGVAYLVVTHQSQHVVEEAYPDPGSGPDPSGLTKVRMAYPSRLAFSLPDAVKAIPLTVEGLLDWASLYPSLVGQAIYQSEHFVADDLAHRGTPHPKPKPKPKPNGRGKSPTKSTKPVLTKTSPLPHPIPTSLLVPPKYSTGPTPYETAIELPWRLILSPTVFGQWAHAYDAVEANDWTELWRTRLIDLANVTSGADGALIRAVWNRDTLTPQDVAVTHNPTGGGNFTTAQKKKLKKLKGKPTVLNPLSAPAASTSPFLTAMDSADRYKITRASSDFTVTGRADIQANKLWLSARGGFLDVDGFWDLPGPNAVSDLERWRQITTQGRDQYVKIVKKGFLFPFGHKAVAQTVTERRFDPVSGQIVAGLRQMTYIVITEPTKSYAAGDTFGIQNDSRNLPFRALTIKTLRSPAVQRSPLPGIPSTADVFVGLTAVNGPPFAWHFVGTDWEGKQIPFTVPAVFVDETVGFDPSPTTAGGPYAINQAYNSLSLTDPIRIGEFTGAEIALAAVSQPGDTNHHVQSIVFGAQQGPSGASQAEYVAAEQPPSYPTMVQASIQLTALEQASGGASLGAQVVSYHSAYLTNAFNDAANPGSDDANAGRVYLDIAGTQPQLTFGSGTSGGVITPNLQITALSRSLGPVAGDATNIAKGTFDPKDVFGQIDAKILGGVKLVDLIKLVAFGSDSPPPSVMSIVSSTAATLASGNATTPTEFDNSSPLPIPTPPTQRKTQFHWAPGIVENPIISSLSDSKPAAFVLDGTFITDLVHPANSKFSLKGTLSNFIVSLMEKSGGAEFIQIEFNSLVFTAATGQKSHTTVDIVDVEFVGCLKFVEQLKEFMNFGGGDGSGDGDGNVVSAHDDDDDAPSDASSDGPTIMVTADGISADLAVALPPIAVGVFSLSNIGVDVGFNLPFDGKPARFRFSFSTRDNPFALAVAIFGGGGFFGIAIGTDGVELIEASLEFGVMCSIDLGVASGSVQLVAGIYFSYGKDPSGAGMTCVLTGFIKLTGNLSILGIISLSLEFDLTFIYEDAPGPTPGTTVSEVTGTATLQVAVHVLMFHKSVKVTATKTFGGNKNGTTNNVARASGHALTPGDPPSPPAFTDQMTSTDWTNYVGAFA